MSRVHTHYDNLRVTRNAPPEVIRAAYKSLSQKFHPDRNPGDPTATRTFQIINIAYEVLSDPARRTEHDEWIAAEEAAQQPPSPHQREASRPPRNDGFADMPQAREQLRPDHLHARQSRREPDGRARSRSVPGPLRRFRTAATLRQASGYLFLTAVATLVVLGIMLG
ncbi:J domain-containing protein [Lacisediminimonas profundi]|uniref:J domain-containing protein n=1 Tax=Lacisediminimonas profundi TaxID=2603856 RepID=UPI00124B6B93